MNLNATASMPRAAPAVRDDAVTITARLAAAEAHCRAAGERWTPPRARAMELLVAADRPLGAYELLVGFMASGYTHPPVVYRALDFLVAHGLAHRLRSLSRFVACAQAPAPHAPQFLVCDGYGRADERPLADFDALEAAAAAQGFQASSWTLEVHGLCPACAGARR